MRGLAILGLVTMCAGCGAMSDPLDASIDAVSHPAADAASASDAQPTDAAAATDARRADVGPPPVPSTTYVYVGRTDGELDVYALDPDSGDLAMRSSSRPGSFPSFAAVTADARRMIVVLEGSDRVAALSVRAGSGATALVNTVDARGGGPTHVAVDRDGTHAFVANYGGGTVAMLPLEADGRLGAAIDVRSPGRNAHAVVVDHTDRWLLVPALGDDLVAVFEIMPASLAPRGVHRTARGAGPRHLALDAAGTHAYLVNELDSTVDVLSFDPTSGTLAHRQTLSTLPSGFSGGNSTAEILVSPDARFVYASNRGHDSIAIFEIEPDARLRPRGHAMLGARTPRSMSIDPSGTFLVAGALDSRELVRFRIERDGSLTRLGATPIASGPFYVGIFAIPDA